MITTARITNCYTIDYFDCTTPKSTKTYELNNLCKIKENNNATKLSYQLLVSNNKKKKEENLKIKKKQQNTVNTVNIY